MWLALNNAFLSIVQAKPSDYQRYLHDLPGTVGDGLPNGSKSMLAVRARNIADLRAAFARFDLPAERFVEWPHRDYPARIFLPRDFVANMVAAQVRGIGYQNFKDSVKSNPLHDAYMAVWSVMNRYGRGEFSRKPKRGAPIRDMFSDTLDPYGKDGDLDYSPPRSAYGMAGK